MTDTTLKQRIASRMVGKVKVTLVSLATWTPGTAVAAMTGLGESKRTSKMKGPVGAVTGLTLASAARAASRIIVPVTEGAKQRAV
jgi:hypothetical protein